MHVRISVYWERQSTRWRSDIDIQSPECWLKSEIVTATAMAEQCNSVYFLLSCTCTDLLGVREVKTPPSLQNSNLFKLHYKITKTIFRTPPPPSKLNWPSGSPGRIFWNRACFSHRLVDWMQSFILVFCFYFKHCQSIDILCRCTYEQQLCTLNKRIVV